jgi:hypothetical protein
LFFFVFPLIDLVALTTDFAAISLINYQSVIRASSQQDFNSALFGAEQEVSQLNSGPFAKFGHLTPIGGYQNSGMNLYIESTNYWNNQTTESPANQPLTAAADLTKNIFEFRSVSSYQVTPFISLASVPFIKDVPGLGKPTELKFETRRVVEHPEGLYLAAAGGTFSGGSTAIDLGSSSGINSPGVLSDGTGSGWNYPNIYQLIANAGETVVEQDVVLVYADNPNWTPTPLQISPGVKVWIDTRADGSWTYLTSAPTFFNANGDPNLTNATGFPTGALLGQVGTSMFMLGVSKWNYPPPATGALGLAMNDDAGPGFNRSGYIGNRGFQSVRVIVTR